MRKESDPVLEKRFIGGGMVCILDIPSLINDIFVIKTEKKNRTERKKIDIYFFFLYNFFFFFFKKKKMEII